MENHKGNKFSFSSFLGFLSLWLIFFCSALFLKSVFLFKISKYEIFRNNNIFTIFEVHNTGAAFNILSNHQEFIIIASFIALLILTAVIIYYSAGISFLSRISMALLSAGISVNTFERINYGYVTDYFYFNLFPDIPVFNVPDIMIVIGASLIIYSVIRRK